MERTTPEGAAFFKDTLQRLRDLYGAASRVRLCSDLSKWLDVFKVCQAAEVWQVHGDWVTSAQPGFGPGVKERFQMASAISPEQHASASAKRKDIAERMLDLLGDDAVIVSPSSPGAAPLRSADAASLDGFRMAALELLCPAGLAGLPQASIPAGSDEGAPLGLSLIGGRKTEETLLGMASTLELA